jgi:hypothetical protein
MDISIVDFIGKVDDGVGVLLSLRIEEEVYELIYWFNKEGKYRIVVDPNFLIKYNISDIYQHPKIVDLIRFIDFKVLPKREEIWKEFDLD